MNIIAMGNDSVVCDLREFLKISIILRKMGRWHSIQKKIVRGNRSGNNRATALFSRTRNWCNKEVPEKFFLFHQDITLEHKEEKRNIDFGNTPA